MRWSTVALSGFAAFIIIAGGCKIQVQNGVNGDGEEEVKIATPAGGLSINTGRTSAQSLGMPIYPGAQLDSSDHGDKSANIHMGFGAWQMRVQVASYQTPDPQDKVAAFYRKALTQYGMVIECIGGKPVGPAETTEDGLSCDDSRYSHDRLKTSGDGLELKAGSRVHQHIVALKRENRQGSKFSLIALDLPGERAAQTN